MQSAPRSRPSMPSSDDNGGFYLVVCLIGLCIGAYLVWNVWHGVISSVVMTLFHHEISFLKWFTDRFDLADQQMMAVDPEGVKIADLYGIAHAVGTAFRIPAAILMVLLAAVCMMRAAPSRYRRSFDLDGLIKEQARSFKVTSAFVDRHLQLRAPGEKLRPSDYALTPEEWVARYGCDSKGAFDEVAVRAGLSRQLGAPWRGVEHAAPQVRAMFAVFALHLTERRQEALNLLGMLSLALQGEGGDAPEGPEQALHFPTSVISTADQLLLEYDLRTKAAAIAAGSGYANTALMAVLTEARRSAGVLAPAQFAFLKLVDRPLWYALHSLGYEGEGLGGYLHPAPRVEAAGSRDHWAAERALARPLVEPSIDSALGALRKLTESAVGGASGRDGARK